MVFLLRLNPAWPGSTRYGNPPAISTNFSIFVVFRFFSSRVRGAEQNGRAAGTMGNLLFGF
jgi:hypothetical protein